MRLAEEYDAAQERGEALKQGQKPDLSGVKVSADELGLSYKGIHESRKLRDARREGWHEFRPDPRARGNPTKYVRLVLASLGRVVAMALIQLALFTAQQKDTRPGNGQCDDRNNEFKERHSFTSLRILPRM